MLLVVSLAPIRTNAATQTTLKQKLQTATSETIRKFYYADLNEDGQKEAIGITSRQIGDFGYTDAKVWYITKQSCKQIVSCKGWDLYEDTIAIYRVKNTRMLVFDAGAGGSGWLSYAYTFKGNQAKAVENIAEGVTYLGKNQFEVTDSQFDAGIDGTGHTWNKYYSKWNGKKLVEYGGLEITQAQLKKAKNGAKILRQIKKQGTIGTIYYRANHMIFVNYTTADANYNVKLRLKNGALCYDFSKNAYGDTPLEKATSAGIIYKNLTNCVSYPKKFPVS